MSDTPAPTPPTPPTPPPTPGVQERVDRLTARIHELEALVRDVPALRARDALQSRENAMLRFAYAQNLSDDAMDPEVIEDAGRRYDRHVAQAGDKAVTFAEFLAELHKAPPVTLRAAFSARTPSAPSAPETPPEATTRAPAGRVNNGTIPKTGPPPSTTFSDEQVAAMTPDQVRANLAGIMAAAAAAGEITAAKSAPA